MNIIDLFPGLKRLLAEKKVIPPPLSIPILKSLKGKKKN